MGPSVVLTSIPHGGILSLPFTRIHRTRQAGRRVVATKGTTREMAEVREVTDATWDSDVLKSDLPVLVDFWAPWCGPCRMVAPIVQELSEEYAGKVSFMKMNTDENPMVPSKFGIRSIPSLLIFKGGELKGTVVGFRPKSDLKKRIDEALV